MLLLATFMNIICVIIHSKTENYTLVTLHWLCIIILIVKMIIVGGIE